MAEMRVAQALERAKGERGYLPESITVDNGGEFWSRAGSLGDDAHGYVLSGQGGQRRTGSSRTSTADYGTNV